MFSSGIIFVDNRYRILSNKSLTFGLILSERSGPLLSLRFLCYFIYGYADGRPICL